MLNAWLGVISSPGPGKRTIDEIMLPLEGISPMTTPLQEPPVAWVPFVKVLPVQKLMKLAGSVSERACWALGLPTKLLPAWTFEASRVRSLLPPAFPPALPPVFPPALPVSAAALVVVAAPPPPPLFPPLPPAAAVVVTAAADVVAAPPLFPPLPAAAVVVAAVVAAAAVVDDWLLFPPRPRALS